MITKAEIQSIDLTGNTCIVRIPLFESVNSAEVITKAVIAIPPGIYNGYNSGDIVFVAFDDGHVSTPVVIGKLYRGAEAENTLDGGTVKCNTLVIKDTTTNKILEQILNDQAGKIAKLEDKVQMLMQEIEKLKKS